MLKERELWGDRDKVRIAIERLRHFEPPEGYYVAFSGGKDSVVIEALARMSGVKHDTHYSVTTIDPPELVRFIRDHYPRVIWERPERPLLKVLAEKGFPQRHRRWCCELYKENGGNNRCVVTGVRHAESYNRSRRKIIEHCMSGGYKSKNKTFVNPIIDWSTGDVWEFIRSEGLPYCGLYDEGWERLGCLMCPMARGDQRIREAERYPKMVKTFVQYFQKMYEQKKKDGKNSVNRWKDGEEMFWWWLNEDRETDDPRQKMLFE